MAIGIDFASLPSLCLSQLFKESKTVVWFVVGHTAFFCNQKHGLTSSLLLATLPEGGDFSFLDWPAEGWGRRKL